MAQIKGIDGMSPQQLAFEVNQGAKFIVYRYCFSALVVTVMQGTDIYFLRPGQNRISKGIPWILLTLVAGWWGFPWGPIRSMQALWTDFSGGLDVTADVVNAMNLQGVNWTTAAAGK